MLSACACEWLNESKSKINISTWRSVSDMLLIYSIFESGTACWYSVLCQADRRKVAEKWKWNIHVYESNRMPTKPSKQLWAKLTKVNLPQLPTCRAPVAPDTLLHLTRIRHSAAAICSHSTHYGACSLEHRHIAIRPFAFEFPRRMPDMATVRRT